jgi:hypothetical protein
MNVFDVPSKREVPAVKGLIGLIFSAALLGSGVAPEPAHSASPPAPQTDKSVEALALQWFGEMQSGQIDRAQLTDAYSKQLSDEAVKGIAKYLKDHDYGVPPSGAEVLTSRAIGEQTFYVVKLIFPRGDAASLMFGFDAGGKITGITIMSMAGD